MKSSKRSRPVVFCKKCVLKNFAKFTGKHLWQSFSFNKFAGVMPATLLKKRVCQRCFPVNFAKFLRTPFFLEHLWWLLLELHLILISYFMHFPVSLSGSNIVSTQNFLLSQYNTFPLLDG